MALVYSETVVPFFHIFLRLQNYEKLLRLEKNSSMIES